MDSNPRAAITWSLNGSSPPHDYNTSVFAHNGTVTAKLVGVADCRPAVVCYANNAHGNDSKPLLQEVHGTCCKELGLIMVFYCVSFMYYKMPSTENCHVYGRVVVLFFLGGGCVVYLCLFMCVCVYLCVCVFVSVPLCVCVSECVYICEYL